MNHTNRAKWVVLFAIFLAAQACVAQFWEKKPYQQWSKDETQKMLSDSPWAREVVLSGSTGTASLASKIGSNTDAQKTAGTGISNTGAQITYQVQIRTAKPIRQAIVHSEQLSPRYAQLAAERKQAIEANAEQFINGKSDDIVFWVNYRCDVQNLNTDLVRYWSTQTMGSLTNTIFLKISDQDKAEPNYFAPGPGQSFEIHFPRPRKLPADGSMSLEFRHPSGLAGVSSSRVAAEFKTKKMTVDGTGVY